MERLSVIWGMSSRDLTRSLTQYARNAYTSMNILVRYHFDFAEDELAQRMSALLGFDGNEVVG